MLNFSRWSRVLAQTRSARTRGGAARPMSQEDEDTLLQQLQAQYDQAKARLAKEEEARQASGSNVIIKMPKESATAPTKPLDKSTSPLWDVLTEEEHKKLATFGIKTLEQLQQTAQEADGDLNRPPYPPVQKLRPKYRLAYELHESIPRRLALKGSKRNS
ncbi:hypothetical protein MIND_00713600 [Mycena indigotica]|uniref:Uncharacterized protein n=1 Tax=Mycena indigotica TaxID=2126181 RepID=A0A8H6SNH2_9AGAR|nr:uncharacterized protein MIND_00713600 [Mycena indigotica]KAF7301482.1 hypothetical protein MIND_00713600 [Mycena indigotica]